MNDVEDKITDPNGSTCFKYVSCNGSNKNSDFKSDRSVGKTHV